MPKEKKSAQKLDGPYTVQISNRHSQPDKQERSECTRRRHIKASVGQAVRLKQDVPLFLASMWNSVSSRAGPWLLSPANGERAQADKAEGICSTFHRPFKQHTGSENARLWVRWLQRQSHYGPTRLHLSRSHVSPSTSVLLSSIWEQSAAIVPRSQGFSINQLFKLIVCRLQPTRLCERLVLFRWVKTISTQSLSPARALFVYCS